MAGLGDLKLRLGIAAADRTKDELLRALVGRAQAWARDFCRLGESDALPDGVAVEMAAHDYAALGAEGVESRSISGLSEKYAPEYPERIMSSLRRVRKIGVPS